MVRHSYTHEMRASLTFPLAASLAEGSFTGVVAAKNFDAGVVLMSLITSAPMFGNIMALIETDLIVTLQSAGDRADRLSMFTTYFGDPNLVNVQADRYRAVTPEQVNAFVRERLVPENRASLLYVPRDSDVAPASSDLAMAETP